jgi:hypothetical protein
MLGGSGSTQGVSFEIDFTSPARVSFLTVPVGGVIDFHLVGPLFVSGWMAKVVNLDCLPTPSMYKT